MKDKDLVISGTIIQVPSRCQAGHYEGEKIEISCYHSGCLCGYFYHHIFPVLSNYEKGSKTEPIEIKCPKSNNPVKLKLFKIY